VMELGTWVVMRMREVIMESRMWMRSRLLAVSILIATSI